MQNSSEERSPETPFETTLIASCIHGLVEHLPVADFMSLCVDRTIRARFEEQRQLYVSRHVFEKFHFSASLYAGLQSGSQFADCVDVDLLEQLKSFDNPVMHLALWQQFAEISQLPRQKAPAIIDPVRNYAEQWKTIALRQNGLFAYFINFAQKCGAIDSSLRHYGKTADEMMRGLLALTLLYDLHKPAYEKMLTRHLINMQNDADSKPPADEYHGLVFANNKPSRDQMGYMVAKLFTLDDHHNLQLNMAYLNTLLMLVQQNVGLEHMRKEHYADSVFSYQHSIFNKAIAELRDNGLLTEAEEEAARGKHFVCKPW